MFSSTLLFLLGARAVIVDQPNIWTFDEWLAEFGQHPNPLSHTKSLELRKEHYNANLEKIKAHNSQGHSWSMGLNNYADLTPDEFASLRNKKMCGSHMEKGAVRHKERCDKRLGTTLGAEKKEKVERNPNNPKDVDWRKHDAVTSVKTQGACGACWSFASTGAIEGAWKLAGGKMTDLSEQQLIDCNTGDIYGEEANSGCQGGTMDPAFEYIMKNKGITTAKKYPYLETQNSCNKTLAKDHIVNLKGYQDVTVGSEEALENALAKGPVALGIEADETKFQLYHKGIFSGPCGEKLDHGVLAVGYGEENGKKYWLVKNSWGESWGEGGYIRIERGKQLKDGQNGLCGVLSMPTYPIILEGSFEMADEK